MFDSLCEIFTLVFKSYTPFVPSGVLCFERTKEPNRGRPWMIRPEDSLGLVLAWTRKRGSLMVCHKPLIIVPYIRTFGAPDQGQMLDVQESQTAKSALRDNWTWNIPHHTLEVVLEVTLEHMCTGLRP